MKEKGDQGSEKERESSFILMDQYMKDNGRKIKDMVMDR